MDWQGGYRRLLCRLRGGRAVAAGFPAAPSDSGEVLLRRPVVRGDRGDDVTDPAEHPAGADPHPRRDDQPEDAAQEVAVVELPDARKDRTEYGRGAWISHVPSPAIRS